MCLFSSCYPYVNPFHFRHACNLITGRAADKKEAACKVATAYYTACLNNGVSVSVPSECSEYFFII